MECIDWGAQITNILREAGIKATVWSGKEWGEGRVRTSTSTQTLRVLTLYCQYIK